MSWIKTTQYLPGDGRRIQIWGCLDTSMHIEPPENHYGYYVNGKFWSLDKNEPLINVTHWADMLGKPEEA